MVASPQEERDLFYISTDIPFDDRPNLLARVDDLDLGLLCECLATVGGDPYGLSSSMGTLEVARDMRLVSGPTEDLHPLNVGILMFCERPDRFFRYARIEVAEIPDPTGDGMIEATFTGPIQRQLRDALSYIENHIIREIVIKRPDQPQSDRAFNYPLRAVQEILANAVYHRSYQVPEPITVRVTPQGMEITSFPGFDRSISDDDVAERRIRARSYRNRRIGDFLKELGLIEGRNTGFPNAYRALQANGSGDLVFETDDQRGFLSVTIPVHPAFAEPHNDRAEAYEKRILDAISRNSLTLTELARAMGYKGITKKLAGAVDAMVRSGALLRAPDAVGAGTRLSRGRAEGSVS